MKRSLWTLASFAILCGVTLQAQQPLPPDVGPGAGGAKLRLPGLDPDPVPIRPAPKTVPVNQPAHSGAGNVAVPDSMKKLWSPALTPMPSAMPATPNRIALPPSNPNHINRDIEITPEVGPWVIFVMSYPGEKAPEMGRKLVMELRNSYKLKAYIYNYGAKEKQAEYERVQALKQKQIDALKKAGYDAVDTIRVRTVKIEEYVGVLVGGYRDRDEAFRALQHIRGLKPPDPEQFKFDIKFQAIVERDKSGKEEQVKGEAVYVNPFHRAFPARNPTANEQTVDTTAADMAALKKINEGEPLSLFQCKGKLTLVISQFHTGFKMADEPSKARGIFDWMYKGKTGEWQDNAAHNAHNLAEAFRKSGLNETYVLHTKNCSFVTVGGYDSEQDPRLIAMQNLLESRFKADAYRNPALKLMPRPIPMLVPRVN